MCGFVGGTNPQWDYAAALEAISHRGPDARRLQRSSPIHVGFCRLAVIDLRESANQPMVADDGETWIAFNGEIYDYKTLRGELERAGQEFHTDSDTEVLLRAYLAWGDDFIDHIDGMFAIVLWDASERKLKLFRDRPGIKPLYYYYDGQHFAFASELKALRIACRNSGLQTDTTALYDFLTYRCVPAPKTLYRNCFKLLPAHSLTFLPDSHVLDEPRPYWRIEIPEEPEQRSLDECAEELRGLIDCSVREQMIADVPIGFFLSGGVDSSTVVASASTTPSDLMTFSIGFDSEKHSELRYAREVAERLGTEHIERTLTRSHAHEMSVKMRDWFDEPFADDSSLPTQFVAATAREHVTVALTGDGGDEVFGGYRTYTRFARYSRYPSWSSRMDDRISNLRSKAKGRRLKKALSQIEWLFSGDIALWGKLMGGLTPADKRDFAADLGIPPGYDDYWQYRRYWREDVPVKTRLQLVDFHTYMPDLILTKVDRTSMSVSLEARVPLLDRRIIEFSFGLPESIRYAGGQLKGLLKYAYRDILPGSILDRKKKGFGTPRYYFSVERPDEFQKAVFESFMAERSS
jgi:asparagine synthase (glutamine-hydrolysing)